MFSDVLESCLETSNAQLVLAHLEIARLRTSLLELKKMSKGKNNAVRKDEETAKEKLTAKELQARKATISKAKKEWRAQDVAERKKIRAKQVSEHQKACKAAQRAGRRKPAAPKAPPRPATPTDSFFEAILDGEDGNEEAEESGDEEEEE
ncbi:hypothetical protein M407DRAFT_30595 [Tulasnella calospora MUT 4182]|uniref:Uncharacterized protein n=1 Tax=Tulasnella calospora MUT 4182 TaxID=1051891 RepID=A0A0C3LE83_9AGAM|nr:hypothetical protein M407DRAFT_30595 [Tulasnella calospora MUT 4182]